MKITLSCGCKGSLNKRKKTFTVLKLCGKHFKELLKRIHNQMWYGMPYGNVVKPFGESIFKGRQLPHYTYTLSSQVSFWLRWLDQQRRKALGIEEEVDPT
jgi:hypothetical protein